MEAPGTLGQAARVGESHPCYRRLKAGLLILSRPGMGASFGPDLPALHFIAWTTQILNNSRPCRSLWTISLCVSFRMERYPGLFWMRFRMPYNLSLERTWWWILNSWMRY